MWEKPSARLTGPAYLAEHENFKAKNLTELFAVFRYCPIINHN